MKPIYLATALILTACNIRAVAILETEDAVYGNTTVQKVQKYDSKQRHLDALESIMGVFNSDSLKALGGILNEKSSSDSSPVQP